MYDVSIEYAHIYTNKVVDKEHETSLKLLDNLDKELAGKSKNLVVMVDDYSFPDPTFDYDEFSAWLDVSGNKPHVMIRESQLIPACDEVLKCINTNAVKDPIVDYIKAKKYPCSLFIAAWYLVRLGYISSEVFDKDNVAKRLINILPESFEPFEKKGLEIITATPFAEAVQKIEYRYMPGRLIA